MAGLPRAYDNTRPREAFEMLVLHSIERLTLALRRGDPFTAQGLTDMQALDRRLSAFHDALKERLELIENGDLKDETAKTE